MIEMKKLKDLVELMVANDLTELDIQGADDRVTIKRGKPESTVQYVSHAPQPQVAGPPVAAPAAVGNTSTSGGSPAAADAGKAGEGGGPSINSPMVGVFYSAANPDSKPFVGVGDRVGPDTVVCIIEAMKVFNEIKAEVSGVIEKVLVENGQAVEFGQPLFSIRPG